MYDHEDAVYITKEYASMMSDEWLNFSVIRHPYIRFMSLYKHFIIRDPLKKRTSSSPSTAWRVRLLCRFPFDNTDNLTCNHHMKSICSFLMDKNAVIIPDIVFRFEEEYDTIIDFLNSHGCELRKPMYQTSKLRCLHTKKLIKEAL